MKIILWTQTSLQLMIISSLLHISYVHLCLYLYLIIALLANFNKIYPNELKKKSTPTNCYQKLAFFIKIFLSFSHQLSASLFVPFLVLLPTRIVFPFSASPWTLYIYLFKNPKINSDHVITPFKAYE